jgi:predicted lactoylglutathione lyase
MPACDGWLQARRYENSHSAWEDVSSRLSVTEDSEFVPNQDRIAFHATSREQVDQITRVLRQVGAREIDGPADYQGYYATFFEDPDGNKFEICHLTPHRLVSGR